MNIEVINYDQFLDFAQANSQFNVLQSIEHAQRMHKHYEYIALIEDQEIKAAGLFGFRNVFLGYQEVTCQMGPILDYNNSELVSEYFKKLKDYLVKKKVFELIINPNIILQERDINGELVENGINNLHVKEALINSEFKQIDITNHPYLINWYFIKDLSNIKNEEELINSFASKTRYNVRRTLEQGIKVREMKYEEMDLFMKFMEEASDKHDFKIRSLSYYQELYKKFVDTGHGQYLLAYFVKDDLLNLLQHKISEGQQLIENTPETSKKNRNIIKEANIRLTSHQKRYDVVSEIETSDGFVNLGAAMFYVNDNEVIYFSSGMNDELKSFEAPYAIQYEAMKRTIQKNIPRYNFYGTNGHFNGKPQQHGIYEFKKGFTGVVEELVGYYSLIINPLIYKSITLLKKITNRN